MLQQPQEAAAEGRKPMALLVSGSNFSGAASESCNCFECFAAIGVLIASVWTARRTPSAWAFASGQARLGGGFRQQGDCVAHRASATALIRGRPGSPPQPACRLLHLAAGLGPHPHLVEVRSWFWLAIQQHLVPCGRPGPLDHPARPRSRAVGVVIGVERSGPPQRAQRADPAAGGHPIHHPPAGWLHPQAGSWRTGDGVTGVAGR